MGSKSFLDLVAIIARLRDPVAGCPWDRAQDHRSLRSYLLEECYEVLAAIDAADPAALCDELGDVLLQVLLHSQIASESGEFAVADVIEGLAEKLTHRHPHVFGDAPSDLTTVRRRWEELKRREPRSSSVSPPLVAARKAIDRSGTGPEIAALAQSHRDEEVRRGARLLAEIRAAWDRGIDPEIALRKAIAALTSPGET
jgi:uncharacterized protein YabN with tetrapyrrole methylase and pyrophosphatase domain